MAIFIPILTEYNDKGAKAAQMSLKKLAIGAGVAGIGMQQLGSFLMDASKAAIEDKRSQELLAVAIRNNTTLNDQQVAGVEDFIAATQDKTNVLDDKLRPALATLVRYTKDATKAELLLQTAMDVSAGTGKDLGSVATALGKAYDGNFTALKRLGIPMDDTIVKTGDFEQAWTLLNDAFYGSQDAITKAEGKVGDMRVAWENFKEEVGAPATDIAGVVVGGVSKVFGFLNNVNMALQDTLGISKQVVDEFAALSSVETAHARSAEARRAEALAQLKANEAAAKSAKNLADANGKRLTTALTKAREGVAAIRREMDGYAKSVSDAISGTVSLSDALSTDLATQQDYNDALAERAAAYEELNAVQARGVDLRTGSRTAQDAADYAAAMEKVAAAEQQVTKTQQQRKSYSQLFAEQIQAAKDFAGTLKQLIANGLGKAGLAQLLDLGPVAGAQVAKDMLSGAAGLTVAGVNEALTSLASVTGATGMAAGSAAYGGQLATASATAKNVQYALTQDIKVVSNDPDAVVAALVKWAKKNGKLPSVVKVS